MVLGRGIEMIAMTLQNRSLALVTARDLGLMPPAPPTRPLLEVADRGDYYALITQIPDLKAEELRITVGPDFLEVEGHHRSSWKSPWLPECLVPAAERELDFARRFRLDDLDVAAAEARFEHGRLEVRLPKRVGYEPKAGAERGGEQVRQLALAA